MATLGRPLSVSTIVKRLRHLRDNVFFDTTEQQYLDEIASDLASNPNPPTRTLEAMIETLQGCLDRMPTHATDDEVKMLTSCVDSLARLHASRPVKTKPKIKAKPLPKVPDWIEFNQKAEAEAKVRNGTVHSLTGAIRVILDEIDNGEASDNDFDTVAHLARTLQRVY